MNSYIKYITSFVLLFAASYVHAQQLSDLNWYFSGNDKALVFGKESGSAPIIDLGKQGQQNTGEKVTLSHPVTGDLLAYVDRGNVYDASHQIMPNGNGLFTDIDGLQSMVVSPVPGANSANKYYIFHRDDSGQIFGTIIDMNEQGNRQDGPPAGIVIDNGKNIDMNIPSARGDGMLTVSSFDGSTFWLVTQRLSDGLIEYFEIPDEGSTFGSAAGNINLTNAVTVSHFAYHNQTGRIAIIPSNDANIEILDFRPNIPEMVHEETLLNSFVFNETFGGSAGWSLSGANLYFSRNTSSGGNIYRYQFETDSTESTLRPVLANQVAESLSLKLAPDSAIYHLYRESTGGTILLGRITQADSLLSQVNYESQLFEGESFGSAYFANFNPPESIQPQIIAMAPDQGCANNPVQFYPIIFPSDAIPTDVTWEFQPINMGSENYAPIMTFEEAGAVAFSVSANINGQTIFSAQEVITIEENDLQVSLPDTTICPGEVLELDAEPQSSQGGGGAGGGGTGGGTGGGNTSQYTYLWNTGATTQTIEVTEAGNYWVVVTPESGCAIYATTEVRVYGVENQTANIWYFGQGAGIDFNEEEDLDPPPRSITDAHAMTAPAGTSTISDQNGDVLFYSNGQSVWNRENGLMPNGENIGGDSLSTQAVIIVPFVDDETLYYLFTTQQVYGENTFELKYSVVDMKEDDGKGDVIFKDIVLFTKSTEKIAAFEAGGGYWVLSHEYGNNTFRAYPISEFGIGSPVISSAGKIHTVNDPLSGQAGMKFSADGASLAVALIEGADDYLEVFNFDQQTGEVEGPRFSIDLNEGGGATTDQVYDVHFSSGGNKVFATMNNRNSGTGSRILEYRSDSLSTDETRLESRADITNGQAASLNLGQIQTGPDQQLYVATQNQNFVGAIFANEDTLTSSSYNAQQVELLTGVSLLGLPNFVQNNASSPQEVGVQSDTLVCVDELVSMSGNGTSDIDVLTFSITSLDDNSTVFTATGTETLDTTYVFSQGQGGLYNLSLNVSNRCGFDTTIVRPLEVLNTPDRPTVPQAAVVCEPDGTTLDAAQGVDATGLSFEWTDSQGAVLATTPTYTIQRPEIYTVTITNTLGCSSSAEIFAGPPFDISLPETAVICEGEELILDPEVTADNYIWTIINPDNSTSSGGNERRQTIDSSVPGQFSYVVSIEDPITPGCFASDTTLVTINALARANISTINSLCADETGSLTFDITTTGSYNYVMTGNNTASGSISGPGSETIENLGAGSYTLSINDISSGCSETFNILIENDNPGFDMTASANSVDCSDPATVGSIDVNLDSDVFPIDYELTSNTGGNPISGTVTNAGSNNSFTINDVPEGTYDLVVTSQASSCNQTQASLVIEIANPVEFTFDPLVELCQATGELSVTAITPGATFNWIAPDGSNAGSGATISGLTQSGVYQVTANAPGACEVIETLELDLSIPPIVRIDAQNPNCEEGSVTIIASAEGNDTYTFEWLDDSDNIIGSTNNVTVRNSGTYTVRARNSTNLNCFDETTVNVTISEPIEANISSTPACDDGSDITLSVDVIAGSPTSFNWTLNGQAVGNGTSITITEEGTYNVSIGDGTCTIDRSINIRRQSIPEGQLPDVEYYCPTQDINPILFAGSGFVTYEWTLNGQPYADADENLRVNAPGVYVVTMTTAVGCVQTDTVTIIESCDPVIVAPNAISTNSGPPNNTFKVFPNEFVDNFEIFIYTRWGELIYQSSTIEFSWNGKLNGEFVPVGTYPYIIRFTSRFQPERGVFEQQGSVTVLR